MAEQKVKLTQLPEATDTIDAAVLLVNQNETDQRLPITHFLRSKNNLSELENNAQARANLGVPSVEDVNDKVEYLIDGKNTFLNGATLESERDFIWDDNSKSWYYWTGVFSKEVPAASTPESTGGIQDGAWKKVGSIESNIDSTMVSVMPQGNLSQLLIYVTPEQFGAIGDGTVHPLSERYSTLAAAQAVYPFVTALTQTIDWAACQAAENYARGKCQVNVNKNKMYHFGSTDYIEFGQKSAWIAPPLGGFDFTTGFIRSVPSDYTSYQFGQLCVGRVMDSDKAGSSDSAFRDLTIKGLTFKWDTARHVASKGLGTIALHLNMAIKANLDVSMFGAEYACFGYNAWGTQGIIRFDSCHKGVYFDAVSLSPEKDTVGGSTTSHHIELQADHTPYPIYLKNCNYAKFHGWFEGALAQYGNYDSANETAMGITLDTCSNVTFDMGIEAWEGAHINCIGSVEAEFKLHYLQDSTDGVLIKGLGTQGVAKVMRTIMGEDDETTISSSNRSLIYVGPYSNVSVKHYAPVLSKYTDSTFNPYVVTVDTTSKITFEQCGMHLGGASRLGGTSSNLRLAPANYQCIESIGCMYMERYMKANETYDYIRNGISRHNAWQTKVINSGDGRIQLDAPTGFRIDDFTAHVVSNSQSSAASNSPLAIVSASNSAVLLQTPINTSSISLMYKLTLKVVL